MPLSLPYYVLAFSLRAADAVWSLATVSAHILWSLFIPISNDHSRVYYLQGTKGKSENTDIKTHTHTHILSLPCMWSTVVCVLPWKQPVQQHSHTAVHWFTASFRLELVVGFGSAFVNSKCRVVTTHFTHCGSICQHLPFLNQYFSCHYFLFATYNIAECFSSRASI